MDDEKNIGEKDNEKDNDLVKREDDKHENQMKNRNRFFILGIVLGIIIFIVSITVTKKYEYKVYPNIYLCGERISGLSKDELDQKLNDIEDKINNQKIYVKTKNENVYIKVSDIVKSYNSDKVSDEIMLYAEDNNTLEKFIAIIMGKQQNYGFDIDINQENIEKILSDIENDTNIEPVEPKVIIDNSDIKIKEGENGLSLDKETLEKSIKKSIKNIEVFNNININAEYKNRSPKIDIENLKKVDTKISSYSTYYGVGDNRGFNIENAVKKLDNIILMPGEEFSYEKAISPIDASNGYKKATVILNGKLTDGIGGGVCQVSSTLYNAQLIAGILPTERRNHSKPVDYVPRGLDATLATNLIDYKFKNTYEYPIVLNTYTKDGKVYTELWSNKNATKDITYEAVSYSNGNISNAYLYGYDEYGNKVYEKHLNTSVYR
ncbi:MAG: VanW family protein [Romboutsia sp.]